MFIAKFSQASTNSKIKPNRHGQMPYIGKIFAGTATTSIINAAIFEGENLEEGVMYLCENATREYDGKVFQTVEVAMPIDATEFVDFSKKLGAPKLNVVPTREIAKDPAQPAPTEKTGALAEQE